MCGPVTVQVDQHVGDDVLGPLLRRVVPGGLGDHGGATLGLAAGRPHRGLLDQEGGHVVEAGIVQAGAQPGDQVDDLRPVGELLQLCVARMVASSDNVGTSNVGETNDSGDHGSHQRFLLTLAGWTVVRLPGRGRSRPGA